MKKNLSIKNFLHLFEKIAKNRNPSKLLISKRKNTMSPKIESQRFWLYFCKKFDEINLIN